MHKVGEVESHWSCGLLSPVAYAGVGPVFDKVLMFTTAVFNLEVCLLSPVGCADSVSLLVFPSLYP